MGKKTTQRKRINTQFSKEDFEEGDLKRIADLSNFSYSMVYKVLRIGERRNDEVVNLAKRYLAAKKRVMAEFQPTNQ